MNDLNREAELSPEKSLEVIQTMINTARNKFSENGHLYLLWGWVVLFCSLAHFVLMNYTTYNNPYMVWMLTWAAFIYQMFYLYRHKRREKVRTYADSLIGFVWTVFVVLMFLFGFMFGRVAGGDYYMLIGPMFLALYGMPTFLSGVILKFRPLVIGGLSCWILSIISTYIPHQYQLLMLALAMVIAWIIPGYAFRAKYKKENA